MKRKSKFRTLEKEKEYYDKVSNLNEYEIFFRDFIEPDRILKNPGDILLSRIRLDLLKKSDTSREFQLLFVKLPYKKQMEYIIYYRTKKNEYLENIEFEAMQDDEEEEEALEDKIEKALEDQEELNRNTDPVEILKEFIKTFNINDLKKELDKEKKEEELENLTDAQKRLRWIEMYNKSIQEEYLMKDEFKEQKRYEIRKQVRKSKGYETLNIILEKIEELDKEIDINNEKIKEIRSEITDEIDEDDRDFNRRTQFILTEEEKKNMKRIKEIGIEVEKLFVKRSELLRNLNDERERLLKEGIITPENIMSIISQNKSRQHTIMVKNPLMRKKGGRLDRRRIKVKKSIPQLSEDLIQYGSCVSTFSKKTWLTDFTGILLSPIDSTELLFKEVQTVFEGKEYFMPNNKFWIEHCKSYFYDKKGYQIYDDGKIKLRLNNSIFYPLYVYKGNKYEIPSIKLFEKEKERWFIYSGTSTNRSKNFLSLHKGNNEQFDLKCRRYVINYIETIIERCEIIRKLPPIKTITDEILIMIIKKYDEDHIKTNYIQDLIYKVEEEYKHNITIEDIEREFEDLNFDDDSTSRLEFILKGVKELLDHEIKRREKLIDNIENSFWKVGINYQEYLKASLRVLLCADPYSEIGGMSFTNRFVNGYFSTDFYEKIEVIYLLPELIYTYNKDSKDIKTRMNQNINDYIQSKIEQASLQIISVLDKSIRIQNIKYSYNISNESFENIDCPGFTEDILIEYKSNEYYCQNLTTLSVIPQPFSHLKISNLISYEKTEIFSSYSKYSFLSEKIFKVKKEVKVNLAQIKFNLINRMELLYKIKSEDLESKYMKYFSARLYVLRLNNDAHYKQLLEQTGDKSFIRKRELQHEIDNIKKELKIDEMKDLSEQMSGIRFNEKKEKDESMIDFEDIMKEYEKHLKEQSKKERERVLLEEKLEEEEIKRLTLEMNKLKDNNKLYPSSKSEIDKSEILRMEELRTQLINKRIEKSDIKEVILEEKIYDIRDDIKYDLISLYNTEALKDLIVKYGQLEKKQLSKFKKDKLVKIVEEIYKSENLADRSFTRKIKKDIAIDNELRKNKIIVDNYLYLFNKLIVDPLVDLKLTSTKFEEQLKKDSETINRIETGEVSPEQYGMGNLSFMLDIPKEQRFMFILFYIQHNEGKLPHKLVDKFLSEETSSSGFIICDFCGKNIEQKFTSIDPNKNLVVNFCCMSCMDSYF